MPAQATQAMPAVMERETQLTLDPEKRYEIINGQPEEKEMPGGKHGMVAMRLAIRLGGFVETHQLGVAFTEVNFQIGQRERIPDLAFVTAARIPAEGVPDGVWPAPPDLAVEITSPNDLHEKVSNKVLDYLDAGVREVWQVSLENQTITIFSSLESVRVIRGESELTSEELLPGFHCKVSELFAGITATS